MGQEVDQREFTRQDRQQHLHTMLTRYVEHMHGNTAVHEWPI